MNSFELLHQAFASFLKSSMLVPNDLCQKMQFELNADPEKLLFGDINCNIALICAKPLQTNPRAFAEKVKAEFSHPFVEKIEIAGPGFLNLFLTPSWFETIAREIETAQENFFKSMPAPVKKIHVEFVSANPTGPMHVGHGRNGILGDALSRILEFLGHAVHKEFYINDAGAQIFKLGNSFKIRCMQTLGHSIELPEDAYHGQYLTDLATSCVATFGKNLEQESDLFFQTYAKDHLLGLLQTTLESYGILFHQWFSEKSLHDHGAVESSLQRLVRSGHTYELEGALWLRSTTFGDDKDRVLRKANGELTYVAADVAYLIDKLDRGFDELIMVLGHDHHSYKVRLHAVMQALGFDHKRLTVILYQLVHVLKDGQPVKMSKRTGNMITLSEIIEEVSKDVARFFFLFRKADAELQFDLDLALKKSNENPMHYIQYAYVRTMSIQAKAATENIALPTQANFKDLNVQEKLLIKKIVQLKQLLPQIAQNHQIHLLAYYAYDVAHIFHAYYNQQRVIDLNDVAMTQHRLSIVKLVQIDIKTAFFIMGITPLEKM